VRFALVNKGRIGASFDVELVVGGGYTLTELEDAQGEPTGQWGASYTKVADRKPNSLGSRQHDCKPVPYFDAREMAPVLVDEVWHLIHKSNMKAVK
jgi:hypothetical protein